MSGHVSALASYCGGRVVDLWRVLCSLDRVRLSLAVGVAHQSRLCGFLEFLEPSRQPVSIRPIHSFSCLAVSAFCDYIYIFPLTPKAPIIRPRSNLGIETMKITKLNTPRDFGVLGLIALSASAPVIEAIFSPPEECRLSAPCSFGMLWSPDGPPEPNGVGYRPPVSYMVTASTTSTVTIGNASAAPFIDRGIG